MPVSKTILSLTVPGQKDNFPHLKGPFSSIMGEGNDVIFKKIIVRRRSRPTDLRKSDILVYQTHSLRGAAKPKELADCQA